MHTYKPEVGEDIKTTVRCMKVLAQALGTWVIADFNGHPLQVDASADPLAIVRAYYAEVNRRHAEWEASPDGKAFAARVEADRKRAAGAAAEGILPFKIRDQEGWNRAVAANNSPYGAATIRYAARWANLMERHLAEGAKLEAIASAASYDADLEGVSGAMRGCAGSILARVWEHGELLRRWHEGGER